MSNSLDLKPGSIVEEILAGSIVEEILAACPYCKGTGIASGFTASYTTNPDGDVIPLLDYGPRECKGCGWIRAIRQPPTDEGGSE